MILVSAQTQPHRLDIDKNLSDHLRFIEKAAAFNADLIVFPELSITGYEREKAGALAFHETDKRLDTLRNLAARYNMVIIAGAPVIINEFMFIGSFILFPDGKISIYTKQFLHPGEEEYYDSSFDFNPLVELKGERISLAICADIDNPEHPENASKVKTSIYIPSIFFSPGGIPGAYRDLSFYAQKYNMCVLMSNFCIEAWGRPSAGQSAFWNQKGDLAGSLEENKPGILVVQKKGEEITATSVYW